VARRIAEVFSNIQVLGIAFLKVEERVDGCEVGQVGQSIMFFEMFQDYFLNEHSTASLYTILGWLKTYKKRLCLSRFKYRS